MVIAGRIFMLHRSGLRLVFLQDFACIAIAGAAARYTADSALLHLICALLIFCMRRPGKLTQKLLRALPARVARRWAARRQSAVQVRKAFKLHSSPTAHTAPQMKTTGARALINKLMRATKLGMQRLSCGDIKKKINKKKTAACARAQ